MRGTASLVLGMIFWTMFINTVRESRIVTPENHTWCQSPTCSEMKVHLPTHHWSRTLFPQSACRHIYVKSVWIVLFWPTLCWDVFKSKKLSPLKKLAVKEKYLQKLQKAGGKNLVLLIIDRETMAGLARIGQLVGAGWVWDTYKRDRVRCVRHRVWHLIEKHCQT